MREDTTGNTNQPNRTDMDDLIRSRSNRVPINCSIYETLDHQEAESPSGRGWRFWILDFSQVLTQGI